MKIGIPKEIKNGEGRVALTPAGVKKLTAEGHIVFVETGAGSLSGFGDEEYRSVGAQILPHPFALYGWSDLIVKVKEPMPDECGLLVDDQIVFGFLHLAANSKLVEVMCEKNITAVAFEMIEDDEGSRPILAPMSSIAGRLAAQAGMHYLKSENGGKGILISDATATIVGAAGTVGRAAMHWLGSLGARIRAFDKNRQALDKMRKHYCFEIVEPDPESLRRAVAESDLLILAAVAHGASAPKIITRQMVASMEKGSVLVDVAIDQGGCSETSKTTKLAAPVYVEEGVIHYCVPNLPGSVPRSSTNALSEAVISYLPKLAKCFIDQRLNMEALKSCGDIKKGIQIYNGAVTNKALADSLGKEFQPLIIK